jgi:ribosomal protein S16
MRGCIHKFPDWPPGARTANGTALCHYVQLYRYFVSQSSEFYRHNHLYCFSTSNTKCKSIFRYRLSPKTFGYTLICMEDQQNTDADVWEYLCNWTPKTMPRKGFRFSNERTRNWYKYTSTAATSAVGRNLISDINPRYSPLFKRKITSVYERALVL